MTGSKLVDVQSLENLKKHGGNTKRLAKMYGLAGSDLVDFSSNINPYGPPQDVLDAVNKAIGGINEYPEQDAETLVEAIAEYTGIDSDHVVVGNGSIELIYQVPQVLKPKKALLMVPSFTEYELSLVRAGAKIVYKKAFSSEEAVAKMLGALNDIDMVVLGNPNNPCGYKIAGSNLIELIDNNPGCAWVVDEAFIDFTSSRIEDTLASDVYIRDNLIVLRSMTKLYSIPGIRLGYMIAPPWVAEKVKEVKYPWSINTIAIEAGLAALKNRSFVEESIPVLLSEAKRFYSNLSQVDGIVPFEPAANYILAQIKGGLASVKLQKMLLHKGFAIRDCSTFTGMDGSYFRVAVKRPEENNGLLTALKEILEDQEIR